MGDKEVEMMCDLKIGICKPISKEKSSNNITDLVQEITVNSLELEPMSSQAKEE